MNAFFTINNVADALTAPFAGAGPLGGLALLSVITAVVLLNVFKRLSNQEKIREHKGKILGHFLEIAIYRDQFSRTLRCQAAVLKHNLLYMRYFMTPILVMMLPMLLVCLQVDYRLGSRPLAPGESFIVTVSLAADAAHLADRVEIGGTGLLMETPALRLPSEGKVFRRARIEPGAPRHALTVTISGTPTLVTKEVAATDARPARFTPESNKADTLGAIAANGEAPIPAGSAIEAIRVSYRPAAYPLLWWRVSPIVYYLVLTIAFGLALRPFFKVTI